MTACTPRKQLSDDIHMHVTCVSKPVRGSLTLIPLHMPSIHVVIKMVFRLVTLALNPTCATDQSPAWGHKQRKGAFVRALKDRRVWASVLAVTSITCKRTGKSRDVHSCVTTVNFRRSILHKGFERPEVACSETNGRDTSDHDPISYSLPATMEKI